MTLLRRLGEARANVESPQVPLTSQTLVDILSPGARTAAGTHVTEAKSLGMSAVYRGVALNAGVGASLRIICFDDTTNEPSPNQLLKRPAPGMTPFEFWELVLVHLQLWGNHYSQKARNGAGRIVELHQLHPASVKVGRVNPDDDFPSGKIFEVTDRHGVKHARSESEIFHIPGLGYDGLTGVSPIRLARQGIGMGLAAEEYGARLFGSGSLMSGILQTEQRLDDTQAKALKDRWMAKVAGIGRAHEVAVLDSGAKWQQVSIPPDDAQFIESRKFQILEIARFLGVPPHLLFDVEKSTSWGSGIEQQTLGWVLLSLGPIWLERIAQRITLELLPSGQSARHDTAEIIKGDTLQRFQSYGLARQWSLATQNDINRAEGRPVVAGGDTYLVPANYSVVDADGNVVLAAGAQPTNDAAGGGEDTNPPPPPAPPADEEA